MSARPAGIKISINRRSTEGGAAWETVETVTLNAANNWAYSWTAADDGKTEWAVSEESVSGYTLQGIGKTVSEDGKNVTFTVTNKKSTPGKTPTSTPTRGSTGTTSKPKTGDDQNMILPLVGMIVAAVVILFAGITLVVLLVAGARLKYLLPVLGASAFVGVIVLLIKSHTSKRIAAFFDPTANQNSAMQGERALEALGNGGIFGTGIGMGMQNEEMGFIGTFGVLLAFTLLFYQGFEIARNSSTRFGKYMAVALTISLFLNFLVHVCVCTGLFPTTGQPLPFLSFGGTNLIFSGLFIGILLNISKAGTGKKIVEPYMTGCEGPAANAFSGFDFTRAEK